jgi:hypothetical protein
MSSLRSEMPVVAAWVDEMRKAFGAEMVDQQIRRGMKGEQTFHATENGHEVGTAFDSPDVAKVFSGDRLLVRFSEVTLKGGKRGRRT